MDETKLLITFENAAGDKTVINISGVRPDVTRLEVVALANQIIGKTIFSYKNAFLTKYVSSQVQTTHTEAL
ncbi:MAG: DUF2922 domain-containing protein [Oscillospiraceae bacterium]|nr:DUF2922 domain-containing protein [Oscillospiraceae bacterium]